MPHPRRVIVDSAARHQLITLNDHESHYLRNVLRLGCGSAVCVVSQNDKVSFDGFITALDPHVQIQLRDASQTISTNSIVETLLIPLLKGNHNDLVVEKCTELGVSQFELFQADRSVVKLDDRNKSSRHSRLEKVAVAAARQCGRASIPQIRLHPSLDHALSVLPPKNALLYCSLAPHARPITALAPINCPVSLVVGPEGDFTPNEDLLMNQRGGTAITLGAMLLRSETAAIAAVAMLHAHSTR